jgi:hypothetical protein
MYLSGDEDGKMRKLFSSGSFEKINLKAKVTFHENALSGLMLIKKISDGNYKLAFYNELGMTYLEGLFISHGENSKLILNQIIPVLNHPSFIKSFEKSLQIAFSNEINPRFHASTLPTEDWDTLKVRLHNSFSIELSLMTNDH